MWPSSKAVYIFCNSIRGFFYSPNHLLQRGIDRLVSQVLSSIREFFDQFYLPRLIRDFPGGKIVGTNAVPSGCFIAILTGGSINSKLFVPLRGVWFTLKGKISPKSSLRENADPKRSLMEDNFCTIMPSPRVQTYGPLFQSLNSTQDLPEQRTGNRDFCHLESHMTHVPEHHCSATQLRKETPQAQ